MSSMSYSKILKDILSLGTPIALMSVISFLSSAIGVYMISHFGTIEIAASALAITTVMTINAMMATSLMGVSMRTGFFRGKKASSETFVVIFKAGLLLGLLISIVGAVLVWFGPEFLKLFHRDPVLIARTVTYFHLASILLILSAIATAWIQFLNGMGKSVVGTWTSLIRLPVAVFTMYVFIFGHFHAPEMQLAGLMVGQIVGLAVALIVLMIYTLRQPFLKAAGHSKALCGSIGAEMKALFNLGWPIGLQYGGELAAMTVAVYMIGAFGAGALAASQIVSQYSMIMVMLSIGTAQAASILIAKVHGETNLHLGHRIMSMSIVLIGVLFVLFAIVVALFGHQILSLFFNHNIAKNIRVTTLAYHLLWVSVFVLFFDALRNLFAFGLRSIGFPQSPMFIGLFCLWLISLPCACVIGFHWLHGVVALRLGFGIGFVIATVWLWIMWYRKVEWKIHHGQQ